MDKRTNDQLTKDVYEFVIRFKSEHDGNSPAFRQIRDECGMSSHSLVRYHLRKLADSGLIRFGGDDGAQKRIEVVGAIWQPPLRIEVPTGPGV